MIFVVEGKQILVSNKLLQLTMASTIPVLDVSAFHTSLLVLLLKPDLMSLACWSLIWMVWSTSLLQVQKNKSLTLTIIPDFLSILSFRVLFLVLQLTDLNPSSCPSLFSLSQSRHLLQTHSQNIFHSFTRGFYPYPGLISLCLTHHDCPSLHASPTTSILAHWQPATSFILSLYTRQH